MHVRYAPWNSIMPAPWVAFATCLRLRGVSSLAMLAAMRRGLIAGQLLGAERCPGSSAHPYPVAAAELFSHEAKPPLTIPEHL
jgi:hypothetical protein